MKILIEETFHRYKVLWKVFVLQLHYILVALQKFRPNPNKKLDKIIFKDKLLHWNEVESLRPFVTSKSPDRMDLVIFSEIPKLVKIFERKLKIWDSFKIEIITENSTINPPIVKIKLIELLIDSPSISPKFEREIVGEFVFKF